MSKLELSIEVEVLSFEELPEEKQLLIIKAQEAAMQSYSPYSGFSVGAALRLDNGEVIAANNQENAVFPAGLCAERVTLLYAKAKYPNVGIKSMAIAARNSEGFTSRPVTPCGSCRQVMMEMTHRQAMPIELLLYGRDKVYIVPDATSLLPLQFDQDSMQ